jgi:hypothetical protein
MIFSSKILSTSSFFLTVFFMSLNFNHLSALHECWGEEHTAWGGNGGWWGGGNREWAGDYDGPRYHSHSNYGYFFRTNHCHPYCHYYHSSCYSPCNQYYYDDSIPGAGLYMNFRD